MSDTSLPPGLGTVPAPPLAGFADLMRRALAGDDLAELASTLIERARRDPGDANALLDLSFALQLRFHAELGMSTQAQALSLRQVYHLGPPSAEAAIRLLVILVPGDLMANVPLDCLLEGSDIAQELVYLLPGRPLPEVLPPHDVVLIAVGEPDSNRAALEQLVEFAAGSRVPVLNRPERSLELARDRVYELLAGLPGVCIPVTARVTPQDLRRVAGGEAPLATCLPHGNFPIIIRPVGSHAGRGLERLESPAALHDYLATSVAREYYVAPFVDYRGSDGLFRKVRVALIDGLPYACHMAVSEDWKIHYLNAGMMDSPAKRREEEVFMADFDAGFAARHQAALAAIGQTMGLDYVGIDCAELPSGELLVFEVDTGMIVHAMDPVDLFPYKQPVMRRVFAAFRKLLADRAARRPLPAGHPLAVMPVS